jgi:hypothetical protein
MGYYLFWGITSEKKAPLYQVLLSFTQFYSAGGISAWTPIKTARQLRLNGKDTALFLKNMNTECVGQRNLIVKLDNHLHDSKQHCMIIPLPLLSPNSINMIRK